MGVIKATTIDRTATGTAISESRGKENFRTDLADNALGVMAGELVDIEKKSFTDRGRLL